MLQNLRKLWGYILPSERRSLIWLFVLTFLNGLVQTLGVISIFPFIAVVAKTELIETNKYLNFLYTRLNFTSNSGFLIALGAAVFLFIVATNLLQMFHIYSQKAFVRNFTIAFIDRYLNLHLDQPYMYFVENNSSEISKKVIEDARNITEKLFVEGFQFVSSVCIALFLLSLVVYTDAFLSAVMFSLLVLFYGGVYLYSNKRIRILSYQKTSAQKKQHKILHETLAAIKDVKVLGNEKVYRDQYKSVLGIFAHSQFYLNVISKLPHFVMDMLTFGGIVLILLYLLYTRGDIETALPVLVIFSLALQRTKPQVQQAFASLTMINFQRASIELVLKDLKTLTYVKDKQSTKLDRGFSNWESLNLANLCFEYRKGKGIIRGVDIKVKANSTIAFIGPSGSGKTTLVDLILGVLKPTSGNVYVNGTAIDESNYHYWQKEIGYIPQNIAIFDDTIANNVAFESESSKIDRKRVEEVLDAVEMKEWLAENSNGLDTMLGDRGIKISGGQRQRIGIARALYRSPSLLVMDEATSALDGITEDKVIQSIYALSGKLTIIMIAHRLTTVKGCDEIYFLEKGKILTSGTYQYLLETCEPFREMAKEIDDDSQQIALSNEVDSTGN